MRKWRAESGIDGLLDDPVCEEVASKVLKCMTYYTGLVDKHKRPLVVWRTGETQSRKLMVEVGAANTNRNHLYQKEKVMAQARALGGEQVVLICDMGGLGMHTADWEALQTLRVGIEAEQKYYPGTFAHIWITRPPWIFSAIWATVSPWLDEYAKERITVLGDDHAQVLLKEIDKDQLPAFLGGAYQTPAEEIVAQAAAQLEESQSIAAGAKWVKDVSIPPEGAVITWVWGTTSNQDLSFGVRWEPADGYTEVVQAAARNLEDGKPVMGHFEAPAGGGGVCQLEWSNEHSWMTSKDLRYMVNIVGPLADRLESTGEPKRT